MTLLNAVSELEDIECEGEVLRWGDFDYFGASHRDRWDGVTHDHAMFRSIIRSERKR